MKKLMLALVCGTFAAVTLGKTIYVSSTATGGGDGSEKSPMTLKEGIDAARENDVVQLLDGEYKANVNKETGDQDPFNLYTYGNVSVVGNVEDPGKVILDAHGTGVRFLGLKKDTVIRGITFCNQTVGTGGDSYSGIWVSGCKLEMDHCVFRGLTNAVANSAHGAAISFRGSGVKAVISNCVFTDICAKEGAVIFGGTEFGTIISNSVFCNCTAKSGPGGVYYCKDSSLELVGCCFTNCSSATHGGAFHQEASKPTVVRDCTFFGNVAQYGGAIGINSSDAVTIADCQFVSNQSAGNAKYGSAICFNSTGVFLVSDCSFLRNSTTGSGTVAARSTNPISLSVLNSVFVGNEAGRGACVMSEMTPAMFVMRNCLCVSNVVSTSNGGMCLELKATAGRVENCTFADNKSLVATGNMWHAPLEFNGGTVSAANCIFMNNLDSEGTHYATWVRAGTLTIDYSAHDLTSENSKSADYNRMTAAEHNVPLTASPFKDAANGDYTLPKKVGGAPNPCLGAGVKLDWMTADSKDLAGNPRLRGDDIVDLGCYEYFQKSGLYLILR